MSTAKRGSNVSFTPSVRTQKEFENPMDNYVATVLKENPNSLDLFVMGNNEFKTVHNVQHSDSAVEGRSNWDYLEAVD